MTTEQFLTSCKDKNIPDQPLLKALWLDYHGQWDMAHQLVDDIGTRDAASIHAYLHRKEGDAWNAGYWYRQARKEVETCSLKKEWEKLVTRFCDNV